MFMTLWGFFVACNILWIQCLRPAGSVTGAGEEMISFKKYWVYWIIVVLLY
jgi:hypothetical protein